MLSKALNKNYCLAIIILVSVILLSCENLNDYAITVMSPGDSKTTVYCETYSIQDDSIFYVDKRGYEGFVIVPDGWSIIIERIHSSD